MIDRHIWKILHESIGIIILASAISSLGGIGIESLRTQIVWLVPVIILLPTLNDMIGDFGSIVSQRFTTMLYQKEIQEKKWLKDPKIHHLFFVIMGIAVLAAVYAAMLSYFVAIAKGFPFEWWLLGRILLIALLTTITLVIIIFFVSVIGGFYVYKKRHDPNNYLIPIATAIADFGSMIVLSALIIVLF